MLLLLFASPFNTILRVASSCIKKDSSEAWVVDYNQSQECLYTFNALEIFCYKLNFEFPWSKHTQFYTYMYRSSSWFLFQNLGKENGVIVVPLEYMIYIYDRYLW